MQYSAGQGLNRRVRSCDSYSFWDMRPDNALVWI